VCQIIEVIVALMSFNSQRRQCPLVTANALLYVAELCSSVKHHVIPLLPVFMPVVIQVATDLSLLSRFIFIAVTFLCLLHPPVLLVEDTFSLVLRTPSPYCPFRQESSCE